MSAEILAIAIVVAAACSLPGTFLLLNRRSLLSDAISHAVLPGIVAGFFLTGNISSPLLIVSAAAAGLFTAWATELLARTRLVKEDAAIGMVFPVLFSIGVIMVSRNAGNIHLDTDAVLLGELAFAPFDRLTAGGIDIGPRSLWSMGIILLINLSAVVLFFKEIKLATFDSALAQSQGFNPKLIHYGLMTLVSITVVGAFDSVGSILVVALMIAPAAAAVMLTKNLKTMLIAAVLFGAAAAVTGYGLAIVLDVSIAGSMASMCGVLFAAVLLFAPERGLIAQKILRQEQKLDLGIRMLVVHLSHHEDENECRRDHLTDHISWTPAFAEHVAEASLKRGYIDQCGNILRLTERGMDLAFEAVTGS